MIGDLGQFRRLEQKTAALKRSQADVLRVEGVIADAGLMVVEQVLDAHQFRAAAFIAVVDGDRCWINATEVEKPANRTLCMATGVCKGNPMQ